ncbi:MAG: hypothetical protein HUU35_18515, partial [Armatimonadetes bacterium]|nr:hypothetical protein [Armatimonadota bacterium]
MGALALFLTCLAPLAAELEAVPLSPGVTSLGDIGLYQVAYRSANQPPVAMPLGWTGWHDSASGVCYVPNQLMQGREALLIHVPWRVPSGPAWVDYRLKLPAVKSIDLAFSTAMRPDAIGPNKGDGVTFSAYVVDGEPRELLREHRDEAIWRDHRFDLSAYAGREVTVRLQVEPGPANNASFDFSYFGEPRIDAGQAADPQSAVQELCDSKAIRATAKADLRRAANARDQGILPSNLLDGVNRLERAGDGYRFVYQGDDATVVYQYAPRTGTLDDWTVSVDGGRSFPPAVDGGFYLARPETPRATGGQAVSVTPDLAARRLTLVWRYPA